MVILLKKSGISGRYLRFDDIFFLSRIIRILFFTFFFILVYGYFCLSFDFLLNLMIGVVIGKKSALTKISERFF
jgi:hypothetical protein